MRIGRATGALPGSSLARFLVSLPFPLCFSRVRGAPLFGTAKGGDLCAGTGVPEPAEFPPIPRAGTKTVSVDDDVPVRRE